jgi:hypothetical protein
MSASRDEVWPAAGSEAARRAAAYGLDLDELTSTARRAKRGVFLVVLGMGLACGVVLGVTSSLSGAPVDFPRLLLGGLIALALPAGGFLLTMLTNRLLVAKLSFSSWHVVANAVLWGVSMISIWGAVSVANLMPGSSIGLPIGVVAWALVPGAMASSFPRVFLREHPLITVVVEQHRELPRWQTLLGGRVRWIVAEAAALAAVSLCAAALFTSSQWLVLPVTATAIMAGGVISWLGLHKGLQSWLAAYLAYCGIMIAAVLLLG